MKEARKDFASDVEASAFGWMSEVSRYQWLVLLVAWMGWVFDSMDGTLFSLVQKPAITELLGPGASAASVGLFSSVIFCVQLLGWAAGGIAFGVMADYLGRTRALAATILIYSLFTGLSAVAANWWQLALFRFITGLGLGGEWAAGAALVAEVWPNRLRARAGAILQSAAAVGFFLAGLLSRFFSWRAVFVVGAIPAIFVLFIRMIVKEPEAWTAAREKRRAESVLSGKTAFTLRQLFSPQHRRDTVTASALAFVALLALWGGTMWIPAAIREISAPETAGMSADAAQRFLAERAGNGVMLLNVGSLSGYLLFSILADWFGRRPAFLFYFVGGASAFPATFLFSSSISAVYLLLPVLGFFTLGVTSGFPIYLPELFPTHLRTTGVGFCYNLGRIVTAAGVFITGALVGFFGSSAKAASAVSLIYLPGLLVLLVARETRGHKLV